MRNKSLILSMESAGHPEKFVRLSQEEEAILAGEINDGQLAINDMYDDSSRLVDMVAGLEDVLIIAETPNTDFTQVDQGLVQVTADMAVAGTEAQAENFIPDTSLSTEAIEEVKAKLAAIWKSVVEYLKKFMAHLRALFGNYLSLLRTMRQRFEGMRFDNAKPKDIVLRHFSAEDETQMNNTAVSNLLDNTQHAMKNLLINSNRDNQIFLRASVDYMRALKECTAQRELSRYTDATASFMKTLSGASSAVETSRKVKGVSYYTKPLPGGYNGYSRSSSFLVRAFQTVMNVNSGTDLGNAIHDKEAINSESQLTGFLTTEFVFDRGSSSASDVSVSASHYSADDMAKWKATCIAVIDTMLQYVEQVEPAIVKQIENLERDSAAVMSATVMEPDGDKDSYLKFVPRINTFVANNMLGISTKVIKFGLQTVRSVDGALGQVKEHGEPDHSQKATS